MKLLPMLLAGVPLLWVALTLLFLRFLTAERRALFGLRFSRRRVCEEAVAYATLFTLMLGPFLAGLAVLVIKLVEHLK